MGFIYLLRVRTLSKHILYKVGKTEKYPLQRIRNYNNDTELILVLKTKDCSFFERKMLHIFRKNFEFSTIGNEYFSGDETIILDILFANYSNICKDIEENRKNLEIKEDVTLDDPLEISIKKYIENNFIISNDIKYKIQFSEIYKIICKNFDSDNHQIIKNILPSVLKKIGLKKKRFNKGMFWFGLNPQNT